MGTEQLPGLGLMKAPLQRGSEPNWPVPGVGGRENQKTRPVSCSFMQGSLRVQLKSGAGRATIQKDIKGYSSVVGHLLSMHEARGSIPSTREQNITSKKGRTLVFTSRPLCTHHICLSTAQCKHFSNTHSQPITDNSLKGQAIKALTSIKR